MSLCELQERSLEAREANSGKLSRGLAITAVASNGGEDSAVPWGLPVGGQELPAAQKVSAVKFIQAQIFKLCF